MGGNALSVSVRFSMECARLNQLIRQAYLFDWGFLSLIQGIFSSD
jgi:hypothetical protein